MEIIEFVTESAANPYIDEMNELLAATEANPDKIIGGKFKIDSEDVPKQKKLIAEAANAIGKTARIRSEERVEGWLYLGITLSKKHAPRRNKEREEAVKNVALYLGAALNRVSHPEEFTNDQIVFALKTCSDVIGRAANMGADVTDAIAAYNVLNEQNMERLNAEAEKAEADSETATPEADSKSAPKATPKPRPKKTQE